eukprot:CAMPEP_0176086222 /NCGR_PEP_ID=MMETSP0120_2-20121206/43158_1 /TAXON_ID=160619 /ORGANISM="Kryptoperidinium foliaceum, Strain CCMP 1326" /LENGTH=144 /DNA_ID=CAMNT_0017420049 /DNA_START=143 /DNA_END=577 /DNA_ORIENTATION=-
MINHSSDSEIVIISVDREAAPRPESALAVPTSPIASPCCVDQGVSQFPVVRGNLIELVLKRLMEDAEHDLAPSSTGFAEDDDDVDSIVLMKRRSTYRTSVTCFQNLYSEDDIESLEDDESLYNFEDFFVEIGHPLPSWDTCLKG